MALTLEMAERFIAAAKAKAQEQGWAMSLAVVDTAGNLVALARMDGARWLTTNVAPSKAFTAATFRRTSMEVAELAQTLPALNYREQDFASEVQKLTDGKGVEVIIENVAADNLAKDFTVLARDGRIVLIGTGTGKSPEATFGVFTALMKDANLYAMSLVNAGPFIPEMAQTLTRLFAEGKIKAVVSQSYPLPEALQALGDLLAGRVFGKLVLTP